MTLLNAAERNKLKAGDFALPKERAYPMHTLSHARDALSRVAQGGTPDERAKVKAAVHKRYPQLAGEKRDMSPNEAPAKRSAIDTADDPKPKFKKPDPSALGSG